MYSDIKVFWLPDTQKVEVFRIQKVHYLKVQHLFHVVQTQIG